MDSVPGNKTASGSIYSIGQSPLLQQQLGDNKGLWATSFSMQEFVELRYVEVPTRNTIQTLLHNKFVIQW